MRYLLLAYVVMDDHVHVLVTLLNSHTLEKVVHSWKSYTAHSVAPLSRTTVPLWQDEYFDRIIRNAEELNRLAQYIANNPLKRWPDTGEYPWLKLFEVE